LLACGASPDEATRFALALRERIRQIGEACGEELPVPASVLGMSRPA
jgi:hypothetical protein